MRSWYRGGDFYNDDYDNNVNDEDNNDDDNHNNNDSDKNDNDDLAFWHNNQPWFDAHHFDDVPEPQRRQRVARDSMDDACPVYNYFVKLLIWSCTSQRLNID